MVAVRCRLSASQLMARVTRVVEVVLVLVPWWGLVVGLALRSVGELAGRKAFAVGAWEALVGGGELRFPAEEALPVTQARGNGRWR